MDKPKCFECQYFAWWDGDYCCIPPEGRWKIITPSKNGVLTDKSVEDITLAAKDCKVFKERENKKLNIYNDAWEEYIKDKEK